MNSGVVRLDQIMPIFLTMYKLAFTAAFCFAHAEHNLIKLNYIVIDQRKLLSIFRRVVYEIQANQSNCTP